MRKLFGLVANNVGAHTPIYLTTAGTILVMVALAIGFGGCAGKKPADPAGQQEEGPLMRLAAIKRADLDAAIANAKRANDQTGLQCWETLRKFVGDGQLADIPEIKGVASAWQEARNIRRQATTRNPVLEEINRGCAAMITEARITLIRLGLIGASGGLGAPLLVR